MDADLSHNPEYLPALAAATADFDVVIGSRYLNGVSVVNWPLHRIFLSAFANRYIRMVTSLTPRDCTSGFRCWRRGRWLVYRSRTWCRMDTRSWSRCSSKPAGAVAASAKCPIIFVERRQGQSKVSSSVLFESLITPWRLLFRKAP